MQNDDTPGRGDSFGSSSDDISRSSTTRDSGASSSGATADSDSTADRGTSAPAASPSTKTPTETKPGEPVPAAQGNTHSYPPKKDAAKPAEEKK